MASQNWFYRARIYFAYSLEFMCEKTMSFPIIVCYKRINGSLYVHLDKCQEINAVIGFRKFDENHDEDDEDGDDDATVP